jgi:hypothetical protein
MEKSNVSKFFRTIRGTLSKHSPEILTGIGIAGMIGATVLAVKATPKALKLIDERKLELAKEAAEEEENVEPLETLPVKEVIKATWKEYVPAAITCAVSTTCLIGANRVGARRYAALSTAYQLTNTAFNEYKAKVVETIGERKEQNIRNEINKDKIEKNPPKQSTVIVTGMGKTLIYDVHSDRYFESDIDRIKRAVNELNRRMTCGMEMYISLNEFYDEIGLAHTPFGNDLGWRVDKGLIDVYYGSQLTPNDVPCVVIEHLMPPDYDYNKLY